MKVFKTLEEMQPFYNEKTNTYECIEDGERIDIEIDCNIHVGSNIIAGNVKAWNVKARNVNARNVDVWNFNAWNVDAWNVKADKITAVEISYYATCIAYEKFTCKSVVGRRENAKHLCLDSEIVFTA